MSAAEIRLLLRLALTKLAEGDMQAARDHAAAAVAELERLPEVKS